MLYFGDSLGLKVSEPRLNEIFDRNHLRSAGMSRAGRRLTVCRILSAFNILPSSRISEPTRFTMNDFQPKEPSDLRSPSEGGNYARLRQIFRVVNPLRKLNPDLHPKLDIRPTVAD